MTFKGNYVAMFWYEIFLKPSNLLNAWNDSNLVLLKKNILHHECGRQIILLMILTDFGGRAQICTNKFYFYGYVKSCFQAYRHEFLGV